MAKIHHTEHGKYKKKNKGLAKRDLFCYNIFGEKNEFKIYLWKKWNR